jgi:hypothetical protein
MLLPVLSECVLLLALGCGERGVGCGDAMSPFALLVALLPFVGEPSLLGVALLASLLFACGLVGFAPLLGERAPPEKLLDRIVDVHEWPGLGESSGLRQLALKLRAERVELLTLRCKHRGHVQLALPQSAQLVAFVEVEGLRHQRRRRGSRPRLRRQRRRRGSRPRLRRQRRRRGSRPRLRRQRRRRGSRSANGHEDT